LFFLQEEKEAYENPKSSEARQTLATRKAEAWKLLSKHKCWLEPKDDKKLLAMWRAS